jgi:hypothetical protein
MFSGVATKAVDRDRNLVVRLADDELDLMHRIAEVERETVATLIRRWIRQQGEVRGLAAHKVDGTRGGDGR